MEPVASRYDFWHWTANVIPLQNFRDWFILSCVLQMLFNRANFTKANPMVPLIYLTQQHNNIFWSPMSVARPRHG
jgi:putative membrane protein